MIEKTKKEILREARSLVYHVVLLFACVIVACIDLYFKKYAMGILLGIMAIAEVSTMDVIMDCIKLDLDALELHAKIEELNELKKKYGIT